MKIRRASYKDIDPLLNLMHELGYPSKKDVIIESIAEYNRSTGYEVFVAEDEGKVIDISCRTKLCACVLLRNLPNIVVFQS